MNSSQAKKLAFLYARVALGIGFLSGVADRFGLWRGRNVGYGNFEGFVRYTAQGELVHACLLDSLPRLGSHRCGAGSRDLVVARAMAALDRSCQRAPADSFRHRDGDILWRQVASGLLGFLCVRCSRAGRAQPTLVANDLIGGNMRRRLSSWPR